MPVSSADRCFLVAREEVRAARRGRAGVPGPERWRPVRRGLPAAESVRSWEVRPAHLRPPARPAPLPRRPAAPRMEGLRRRLGARALPAPAAAPRGRRWVVGRESAEAEPALPAEPRPAARLSTSRLAPERRPGRGPELPRASAPPVAAGRRSGRSTGEGTRSPQVRRGLRRRGAASPSDRGPVAWVDVAASGCPSNSEDHRARLTAPRTATSRRAGSRLRRRRPDSPRDGRKSNCASPCGLHVCREHRLTSWERVRFTAAAWSRA
jgi:hypothetical protein